ncbi:hypothetical protein GCM10023168_05500 [Fodinibacter luteus]|uniref:Uncharacterized protein n=1 Tax=Fodinibacter luteus TaxID=552064 RepID=A0ABP8K0L3_9MICO
MTGSHWHGQNLDEAEDMTLSAAAGQLDVPEIADWLAARLGPASKPRLAQCDAKGGALQSGREAESMALAHEPARAANCSSTVTGSPATRRPTHPSERGPGTVLSRQEVP